MDERKLNKKMQLIATHIKQQLEELLPSLAQLQQKTTVSIPEQTQQDFQKIINASHLLREKLQLLQPTSALPHQNLAVYFGNIRHDIRTPINALKGYSELVLEEIADLQLVTINSALNQILSTSDTILRLIKEINELESLPDFTALLASNDTDKTPSTQPCAPIASKKTRSGDILIVDDLESNRNLLNDWLQRRQHTVISASSGKKVIELLAQGKNIDIILLDVMMPEMDGYEVLQFIKHHKDYAETPVIMISALDEMDSIVKCIRNGAEDYILKPFNSFLLEARIQASLDKIALRRYEKLYLERLQEELSIAQQIQLSMLPSEFPDIANYEIFASSLPAKEVGGDLYDFQVLKNHRLAFCLGDVSGKGIPAALFMAMTKTIFSTLTTSNLSPVECMRRANTILMKDNTSMMFVTLFYGILDLTTGKLLYANAGHLAPLVCKKSTLQIETLFSSEEPALGVFDYRDFHQYEYTLSPGDLLVLYTDGITEATDINNQEFGEHRLKQFLLDNQIQSPKICTVKLSKEVIDFTHGSELFDDLTCLFLSYHSAS